jgi:hypothetical protein
MFAVVRKISFIYFITNSIYIQLYCLHSTAALDKYNVQDKITQYGRRQQQTTKRNQNKDDFLISSLTFNRWGIFLERRAFSPPLGKKLSFSEENSSPVP